MEPTTNLFGAIVFWLYIIAALTFTGFTIDGISKQQPPKSTHVERQVLTFSVLALISFSTLSFNMLHVLISSYNLWSGRTFPDKLTLATLSPSTIWKWSIQSTLFQDFGNAIVQDEARYLWTQSALLGTFSICLFMASEGLKRNIPRLWAFFAVSQILPISFAQNLFYVAVLRSAPNVQKVSFPRNRSIRIIAGYCACLLVAPYTFEGKYLMPTILLARLLLLLPLVLPSIDQAQKTTGSGRPFDHRLAQQFLGTLAVALTMKQMYMISQEGLVISEVVAALTSHPAVTSLGADFLFGIVSLLAWISLTSGDDKSRGVKVS